MSSSGFTERENSGRWALASERWLKCPDDGGQAMMD
jgi:hypothetical protein